MQISFLTLFLGLVVGVHPVAVAVTGAAASVELRLDGRSIALVHQPPWKAAADFGPALVPHILEAVAFDAGGNVVASCRQWVNMPRPVVEAQIVVERDPEGVPQVARIVWDSLEFQKPRAIDVTLDGRDLVSSGPAAFRLPPLEGKGFHLLAAKVLFPRGILASTEIAVGSGGVQEATSDLTGLAMVPRQGKRFPSRGEIDGQIAANGKPLRIVAIEARPAEVVIVRDLSIGGWLDPRRSRTDPQCASLRKDDHVRFLAPVASSTTVRGRSVHLFDVSQRFSYDDGGIARLLTSVAVAPFVEDFSAPQSIADAVAVAGIQALEGNQNRAVVLLIGPAKNDHSVYSISAVKEFLQALHVPLFVWSTVEINAEKSDFPWGCAEDVSYIRGLENAVDRLRKALDLQRIVWVEGNHRPQDVRLANGECPVVFAGANEAGR